MVLDDDVDAVRDAELGETVQAVGRAVLLLGPGASLRLNVDTSIVLNAADRIEVSEGTVYLDSGGKSIEEVEEAVLKLIRDRTANGKEIHR